MIMSASPSSSPFSSPRHAFYLLHLPSSIAGHSRFFPQPNGRLLPHNILHVMSHRTDYKIRQWSNCAATLSKRTVIRTHAQYLHFSRKSRENGKVFCPNCQYKQHECFSSGELGCFDDSLGPAQEVFICNVAICGRFYHSLCIAKLVCQSMSMSKELKVLHNSSFWMVVLYQIVREIACCLVNLCVCFNSLPFWRFCPQATLYSRLSLPNFGEFLLAAKDGNKGLTSRTFVSMG